MPGLTLKVKVLKSSLAVGISTSVLGRMRTGRARNSNSTGASNMPATTVLEYRSLICAGSKPVSAIRKA